jgi:hypothetical protein
MLIYDRLLKEYLRNLIKQFLRSVQYNNRILRIHMETKCWMKTAAMLRGSFFRGQLTFKSVNKAGIL